MKFIITNLSTENGFQTKECILAVLKGLQESEDEAVYIERNPSMHQVPWLKG